MKLNDLLTALNKKQNGAFIKVQWKSDLNGKMCALAKKQGYTVQKEVFATVRKGVKYRNVKSVKERLVREGRYLIDPDTGNIELLVEELPWGQWVEGSDILIKHKDKYYVRLYTTSNKPQVKYFLNGEEIELKELKEKGILINSYWNRQQIEDCFTVGVDNIQKIY